YLGIADRLYLNRGDATFEEVTAEAGLLREDRTLGALLSDFDLDGDLDLYLANDGQPNRLYRNDPADGSLGFRFVDVTDEAQVGDSGSGMG
ncbi:MAG: CRTAC1 family protein, partial [Acidobacteria bacterium]|nr:CRTAC1 family protein [Acidobacteriota bacterium]